MIANNLPLPADPVEHALYADQIAFYKAARARRVERQALSAAPTSEQASQRGGSNAQREERNAALPKEQKNPDTLSVVAHEERLYSRLDAEKIIKLPPENRMQRILTMSPEELMAFRKSLTGGEPTAIAAGLTPIQRETMAALQGSPRMLDAELMESRMLRDIYSGRQLQAVMADFWLAHFNVPDERTPIN